MIEKYKITKEEIEDIKKSKIKSRAQSIKDSFDSVKVLEGDNGIAKLKKELKKIDCWASEFDDLKNIKLFEWYPVWYDMMPVIIAVKIFNWDKEKIRNFARCKQVISFFEKTLLKYFISIEQVFKLSSGRWRKHYSQGDLEVVEINLKEKYGIARLKNFSIHPIFCFILSVYFESGISFVVAGKNSKIECKETKCVFKGDKYHEYIIKWD